MIRRLTILLLIVGCKEMTNLVLNEGICILRDITIPKILCFPQVTESTCYGNTNDNLTFIDWKQNQNCNEFCNSVIDEECEIN